MSEEQYLKRKTEITQKIEDVEEAEAWRKYNLQSKQGEEREMGNRQTARKRKLYSLISLDMGSNDWIDKTEKKRKVRKNINANYTKLTGMKKLGKRELLKRKGEFLDRRDISSNAKLQFLNLMEKDWKLNDTDEVLKNEILGHNMNSFDFASDKDFVDNFAKNMEYLERADILYKKMQASEYENVDENRELYERLIWMQDIREAYMERIAIVSSPYYIIFREQDLTRASLRNLERSAQRGKIPQTFVDALFRWIQRKNLNGKFKPGMHGVQLDEETRSRLDKLSRIQSLGKNLDKNLEEENTHKSARVLDSVKGKIQLQDRNLFNNRNDNDPMRQNLSWMKENLNDPLSKEQALDYLNRMIAYAKDEFKTHPKNRELEEVIKYLVHLPEKVERGDIGLDAVRLFLDSSFCKNKNLGTAEIYSRLNMQTIELSAEKDKKSSEKVMAKHMKFQRELTMEVQTYMKDLSPGTHAWFQGHSKYFASNPIATTNELKRQDRDKRKVVGMMNFYESMKNSKGTFLHIIGKNGEDNVKCRAYISAKPEHKLESIKMLMETSKELKMQDDIVFKFATTNVVTRLDDLVVYFTAQISDEKISLFLKTYEKKAASLMVADEEMPCTTSKYGQGISLAPEPMTVTLDAIRENCDGVKDFNNAQKYKGFTGRFKVQHSNYSYNSFITDAFCQAVLLAHMRLVKLGLRRENENIDLADKTLEVEYKKAFRELLTLNGIDPDTMLDASSKAIMDGKAA